MNYFVNTTLNGDRYRIHMRDANIVEIQRNGHIVEYDDLSLRVREAILIEALRELSKLRFY